MALAVGYSSNVYVEYDCYTFCEDFFNSSISSLNISSYTPIVYIVNDNGTNSTSGIVKFNSSMVAQESSDSVTMVYELSDIGNNTGYYSFVFPFTCQLQPIMYIGNHARALDFGAIENWLEGSHQNSQQCSESQLNVNLLGFTNVFYNRIAVGYETS